MIKRRVMGTLATLMIALQPLSRPEETREDLEIRLGTRKPSIKSRLQEEPIVWRNVAGEDPFA